MVIVLTQQKKKEKILIVILIIVLLITFFNIWRGLFLNQEEIIYVPETDVDVSISIGLDFSIFEDPTFKSLTSDYIKSPEQVVSIEKFGKDNPFGE
jgi:hypothetical protein